MKVNEYFDMHSHHHAYHKDGGKIYHPVTNFIKNLKNESIKILDFGCGDGNFLKHILEKVN